MKSDQKLFKIMTCFSGNFLKEDKDDIIIHVVVIYHIISYTTDCRNQYIMTLYRFIINITKLISFCQVHEKSHIICFLYFLLLLY